MIPAEFCQWEFIHTVQKIKAYGDKYGINHDTWWMLTGPKKEIYDLKIENKNLYERIAILEFDKIKLKILRNLFENMNKEVSSESENYQES